MRIVPFLIATIVVIGLYFFVFEREALLSFAGNESAEEETDTSQDALPVPPSERMSDEEIVVKVVAIHSQASELDSAVILRGESEAARIVNISAETSGKVISEPLRKGAYVEAGQVLCELDMGTRSATLAQTKASVAEAQVALANAKKLAEGGYAAETGVLRAQAALESAKAALAQTENDIANVVIKAPFAGLLETDTAELGSLVQPGGNCATVLQLSPMKLVAFAPEATVDRIEVGTLAGARFLNGTEVTGRVTFLSRSSDNATRTFRVEIEIPNEDFSIRDGQTVEMAIRAEGTAAHLVAQSTLTLNDEGDLGVRTVGADSLVEFMPVDVIRDTPEGMWVAGLPQTADIIITGQEYVRAGVKVAPSFRENDQ